jgi:hypothetical protein
MPRKRKSKFGMVDLDDPRATQPLVMYMRQNEGDIGWQSINALRQSNRFFRDNLSFSVFDNIQMLVDSRNRVTPGDWDRVEPLLNFVNPPGPNVPVEWFLYYSFYVYAFLKRKFPNDHIRTLIENHHISNNVVVKYATLANNQNLNVKDVYDFLVKYVPVESLEELGY